MYSKKEKRIICSGSIINDRYIVTAAHCFLDHELNDFEYYFGLHDVRSRHQAVSYEPEKVISHRDFEPESWNQLDDIALVKFRKTIQFTNHISTICLPHEGLPDKFTNLMVAGWGLMSKFEKKFPNQLQEVSVPYKSHQECAKLFVGGRIHPTQICAGSVEKDACKGDSGGPLMTKYRGRTHVVGIVSWGIDCAHPKYPGFYTRVLSYLDWIHNNTQDARYCAN